MARRIELLSPAGSMACLKAAVSKGADSVYLGLRNFSARTYATNFNMSYLKDAVRICKSNNVRLYLAMNTLIKNNEVADFFKELSDAYSAGIDAVIIQDISLMGIIRRNFPGLRIHASTQAGVLNSSHATLLKGMDRINLARELSEDEIRNIRQNIRTELEVFCHGALCASISGQCLFSSFLGGRSGNRGRCAQPCRKPYNSRFLLSTKDLCLINKIPSLIDLGIDSLKIEGRMRTPYYVATVTSAYKNAIESYYDGRFHVSSQTVKDLHNAFSREFTTGCFGRDAEIFNKKASSGYVGQHNKEYYNPSVNSSISIGRKHVSVKLPDIQKSVPSQRMLLVNAHSPADAILASEAGADVVYLDIFDESFLQVKKKIQSSLYASTPRIMLDSDINNIQKRIRLLEPVGILAGNLGMLGHSHSFPIHVGFGSNVFNDFAVEWLNGFDAMPIISPELSLRELAGLRDKRFACLVHGQLPLMALRHSLSEKSLKDTYGATFAVKKTHNGTEIINGKELGLLSKSRSLLSAGISSFYIDTQEDIYNIVSLYRAILDGKKVNDAEYAKRYVLGWSYRPVE